MSEAGRSDAPPYSVIVLDMFNYNDPDGTQTVPGFATVELAREYARRRTRDSVEEQRPSSAGPKDLRTRWFSFGEDCLVQGDSYSGYSELDYFIAHPATKEERDWLTLAPEGGREVKG